MHALTLHTQHAKLLGEGTGPLEWILKLLFDARRAGRHVGWEDIDIGAQVPMLANVCEVGDDLQRFANERSRVLGATVGWQDGVNSPFFEFVVMESRFLVAIGIPDCKVIALKVKAQVGANELVDVVPSHGGVDLEVEFLRFNMKDDDLVVRHGGDRDLDLERPRLDQKMQ